MEIQLSHFPNCITTTPEKTITLDDFLYHIQTGVYEEEILHYRKKIKEFGKEGATPKRFKKHHIPAVTFAGTFEKRQANGLLTPSNSIIIDVDNWPNPHQLKEKLSIDPHLLAAFISPGGEGLKLVFKVNFNALDKDYKQKYHNVLTYLQETSGLPLATRENPIGLDPVCADVGRLCLYSADPEMYLNTNAKVLNLHHEPKTMKIQDNLNAAYTFLKKRVNCHDIQDQIEAITRQIESRMLDITTGYHNWLSIGFALESELAEAGKDYFHRISQYHPNYNHAQCNKQYFYIQKSKGTGITIKTFFHKAKEHGLDISSAELDNELNYYANHKEVKQDLEELEEEEVTDQPWAAPTEPPSFPLHVFPQEIADFIQASADSINCPSDFIAIPMLTTLGIAIGTSRTIEIKKGWKESPRIYSAIVAEPGSRKTPALNLATSPVLQLQREYASTYYQKKKAYEQELISYERKMQSNQPTEIRPAQRPVPPKMKQLTTNDATMEALSSLLRINPRGILFEQDELAGWVKSMNQYRGGKGSDQEKWLSFWSGKQTIINRKGDDEPLVLTDPFINVTGCIQPDILSELSDGKNNGFLDRILFTYPATKKLTYSEAEIPQHLLTNYQNCFQELMALKPSSTDKYNEHPISLPFSPDAKKEWVQWITLHYAERNHPDFPWYLNGIWAKLEAYTARFALILELTSNPATTTISPQSIFSAAQLTNYFKAHAFKVYQELNSSPADKRITKAIQWIKKKGGAVTLRQCYSNKIAGCKTKEQAESLFQQMKQRGVAKFKSQNGKVGSQGIKKLVLI